MHILLFNLENSICVSRRGVRVLMVVDWARSEITGSNTVWGIDVSRVYIYVFIEDTYCYGLVFIQRNITGGNSETKWI
jgi:hypothetical protein